MVTKIETMAGVVFESEPAGTVLIQRGDGDTIVTLTAMDGWGESGTVHLCQCQAVRLILALGAVTVDL